MKVLQIRKTLSISLLILLTVLVFPKAAWESLEKDILLLIRKSGSRGASWGLYAVDMRRKSVIASLNPDKLFVPASNTKLLTTAAALEILGPDWRYKTKLFISGNIKDGILDGDLLIKGSGDPSISSHFLGSFNFMDNWAEALKRRGIKRVEGDVVVDPSCFDEEGYGPGWAKDYEMKWYAPKVNGLTINDGCLDITFIPGSEVGNNTTMEIFPQTDIIQVENRVKTSLPSSPPDVKIRKYRDKVVAYGTIPLGRSYKVTISVDDPPLLFADLFLRSLNRSGIEVMGKARVGRAREMEEISTLTSPPLREIIKRMNKKSVNLYAEQIFKTCGYRIYGLGTFETGSMAVYSVLRKLGITEETAEISDGSGLSRKNLISPRQIVGLLIWAEKKEWFKEFLESLPRSGEEGSLKDRMRSLKGMVAAKTGHLDGVSSLSGYILDHNGRPRIVFSIIVNNFIGDVGKADRIQDEIVRALARSVRDRL